MTDWIGWAAAALLFFTMASQVAKQWTSKSVAGVSAVLFVGQLLTSILFVIYSVLQGDVVFIVVNAFMVANALVGLVVDRINRRHSPPAVAG